MLATVFGLFASVTAGVILMVVKRRYDRRPRRMETIFQVIGMCILAILVGAGLIAIVVPDPPVTADSPGAQSPPLVMAAVLVGGTLMLTGVISLVVLMGDLLNVSSYFLKSASSPPPRPRSKGATQDPPAFQQLLGGAPIQGPVLTPQQQAIHRKFLAADPDARVLSTSPFTLQWTPRHSDKQFRATFDEHGWPTIQDPDED